jgi:hypothetical protein
MRQLLTESLLLAAAGGVLGIFVAVVGQRALLTLTTPPGAPPLTAIGLNGSVVALLALLTIGTGLACGVVPAIRGSRLDPMTSLKEPGPAAGPARRRMFPQGVLVSAQLALALVLLIGAGLLLGSLVRQVQRDLNFDPDGLVRLDFGVPSARYAKRIGSHNGFPYFEISPPPSQTLERVLDDCARCQVRNRWAASLPRRWTPLCWRRWMWRWRIQAPPKMARRTPVQVGRAPRTFW